MSRYRRYPTTPHNIPAKLASGTAALTDAESNDEDQVPKPKAQSGYSVYNPRWYVNLAKQQGQVDESSDEENEGLREDKTVNPPRKSAGTSSRSPASTDAKSRGAKIEKLTGDSKELERHSATFHEDAKALRRRIQGEPAQSNTKPKARQQAPTPEKRRNLTKASAGSSRGGDTDSYLEELEDNRKYGHPHLTDRSDIIGEVATAATGQKFAASTTAEDEEIGGLLKEDKSCFQTCCGKND